MRRLSIISAVLVALVVVVACSSQAVAPPPNTLQATKGTPQSLDGSDAAWTKTAVTTIKTTVIANTQSKGPVDVKTQALYDQNDIWFRFEWADASDSSARVWTYDGSTWTKPADEDRLGLFWEITPITQFGTKGCAAICHNEGNDPSKWAMITPKDGERADNWHWQAARTNPVGYTDDRSLAGKFDDPTKLGSSFHSDAKTGGGVVSIANPDGTAPTKMQAPDKTPSLGPNFLVPSEVVDLDLTKLKAGARIPGYLLSKPIGSEGDIDSKGVYADGKWIVVMHRKLDTGNDDDMKFSPARSYPFGLAVFDATGDANHTVATDVQTLQFK